MIFKILGSLIIIASATMIGMLYSRTFQIRVEQLRDIQCSLGMLETEIVYTATPLIEAFTIISNKSSEAIGKLFLNMSELLKSKKSNSIYVAFTDSYNSIKNDIYLDKDEMNMLGSFMQSLGNSDIEGQKKNFNLTLKKLEGFEKSAQEINEKNQKLYRYLGICGGILIVIILI